MAPRLPENLNGKFAFKEEVLCIVYLWFRSTCSVSGGKREKAGGREEGFVG